MLWIEVGAGRIPVIYTAEKRRYLVPKRELIKCHMFRCKAHALQVLKKHPDRYEFAQNIMVALLEMPTIPEVKHVQRRTMRRNVTFNKAAFNPYERGDYERQNPDL